MDMQPAKDTIKKSLGARTSKDEGKKSVAVVWVQIG